MSVLSQGRLPEAEFFPAKRCAARIVTIGIGFACMLWLGVRAYSAGTRASAEPGWSDGGPGVELAWRNGAADGQIISDHSVFRVNIEAYNRKREKDIAVASGKLLTLAIALRADLERDPASESSPNMVRKAKEIEKLAHDVKEMMKINMVGPY